jgi:RND family efflux transporter MFP subunit
MPDFLRRLACLALGLSACAGAAELRLEPAQIQSLGITTGIPESQGATEVIGLAAEVMVPNNQLHVVSTPLPGLVEAVLVAVNEPVRRGQVLARMQSTALAEAQRGYLQALTQQQLAQANLDRDNRLAAEGLIAESRLLSTRASHIEATALLAERRHALRLAGMDDKAIRGLQTGSAISSSVIVTASVSGIVIDQMAQAGQRLEAFTPLYRIAQLDPLWLEIQVPLARTAGIREGAAVRVPSAEAAGRIISVGRSVTPESQTVMLRALISTNAARLRPGQYVEAAVSVGAGTAAHWRVPAGALARLGDKPHVFVRTQAGFRAVEVVVVSEGPQAMVISGPLSAGARIAVTGVSALKARAMETAR